MYEYSKGGDLPAGTITDYVQYYADLDAANAPLSEPRFVEEYRASTAYSLSNFGVESWLGFMSRLETDNVLRARVEENRIVTSSGPPPPTPAYADQTLSLTVGITGVVVVVLALALVAFKTRTFKSPTYEEELRAGLKTRLR